MHAVAWLVQCLGLHSFPPDQAGVKLEALQTKDRHKKCLEGCACQGQLLLACVRAGAFAQEGFRAKLTTPLITETSNTEEWQQLPGNLD